MEWFKFYHNKWLTDRAINNLCPQDRLCFITLLCVTSQSDDRNGIVTQYSEQEIIKLTHLDVNVFDDTKSDYHLAIGFTERLLACGVIERIDEATIRLKNFERRQNTNLSDAERAKRYREKSKVTTVTSKRDESNAREDKIREDKIREDKIQRVGYGEFGNVKLSVDEYTRLGEQLPPNALDVLITELDQYLESTGKRYKSHYATIQAWARRRINEHHQKITSKGKNIVGL